MVQQLEKLDNFFNVLSGPLMLALIATLLMGLSFIVGDHVRSKRKNSRGKHQDNVDSSDGSKKTISYKIKR